MKSLAASILFGLLFLLSSGMAYATPKLLPAGTVVSAVIEGEVATVTIAGVKPVDVEFYSYEGVKHLGAVSTFKIKLREGRRFNFVFKDGNEAYYALITPDMANYPPDFFGKGVAADCSDSRGCNFIISKKR